MSDPLNPTQIPTTLETPPTPPTNEPPSLVNDKTPTEQPKEPAAPEFTPLTPEDLKFPEGMEVPEPTRDEFLGILNNRELTPGQQAQALVDLQAKVAQAASEAGSQAWLDMQAQWQAEVKNDPELGGAKLDGTLSSIGKLIDEYGNDELRQVMDLTGAGNNRHVIKFLSNIAAKLTEGGPVSGTGVPTSEATVAELLYPTMKKGS